MKYSPLRAVLSAGIAVLFALTRIAGAAPAAQEAPKVPSAETEPATAAPAKETRPEAGGPVGPAGMPAAPLPAIPAPSDTAHVFDYRALERRALAVHPILKEKQLDIAKAEQQLHELRASAILPKFLVETAVGPAPGLRAVLDTTTLFLPDSTPVNQYQKKYDYGDWGPFFGVEFTIAQPLNLGRYRAGIRARSHQIRISEAEYHKEVMDVSEEAQRLYFQHVYATQMLSTIQEASRELDRAQRRMEELLDDGDESVTQTDLLELKTGRYNLEKAKSEAMLGVTRTRLGISFLADYPQLGSFRSIDSVLAVRPEALPSLDSLKTLTLMHHPDLKRLKNGLAARAELIRVSKGEMGPDIFVFGNFKYSKAWSSDRESGGDDPFARDPLNELTGVGGIGLRLNLNFWQRYEKVRKERIELKQLQRTEAYAAGGLLLKLQDEFAQLAKHKADVGESQKSLRAAEAWLKAAAMKYDLDPGAASEMFDPYRAVLSAKRDYFQAVLDYNISVSKVIKAVGWTLTDYFNSLGG